MESFFIQVFNGLSLGSILLLVALGLAFSFGLMNVINMAHGELIMIGAYVTYIFEQCMAHYFPSGGDTTTWAFLLAIPLAFFVTAGIGMLIELGIVQFLYKRPLDTLIATWGLGLVLQQVARTIFGAPNVSVKSPAWLDGGLAISANVLLPYKRFFIMGLALGCVTVVYFYLYHSDHGRRLRAVMQNREVAGCLGVQTRWVDSMTFAIGSGLAGIAGSALTLIGPIGPTLGTNYIIDAFMVVVLGGVGRLSGTIMAAFLIGMMDTIFELTTTASIGKVITLLLIVLFLQWKPTGLVGVAGGK